MTTNSLGIDISKKDFHVVLLTGETRTKPRKFTNDLQGFESLEGDSNAVTKAPSDLQPLDLCKNSVDAVVCVT